ncbi:MAG: hypothetical protein LYZ69_05455 [Nitrososphaerales archaeon]|nr:hypothetical protein [Nitrososphaerales archaeon]
MTYELACSKCGHTIYSGFELRYSDDILKSSRYPCRVLGAVLDPKKIKVEVKARRACATAIVTRTGRILTNLIWSVCTSV